jgi:hypothetical protein
MSPNLGMGSRDGITPHWRWRMTTFDERERAYEKKFSMDQDFKFKAQARRNRLLAEWAAAKLGLPGEAVGQYVKEVVDADVAETNGAYHKLIVDLERAGVSKDELQTAMNQFFLAAVRQLEDPSNR